MDKVIITVTVDNSRSYLGFGGMPPIDDVEAVTSEKARQIIGIAEYGNQ
jgi:hypothetical protein